MNAKLRLVEPARRRIMQKVARNGRKSDEEYGRDTHKYLTPAQVAELIRHAKDGRHGERDALMISLAYHHALRVSELIGLRWHAIDLDAGTIVIQRKKEGIGGQQKLAGNDRRTLRAMAKRRSGTPYVFLSERGTPLTRDAFAKQLAAAGDRVGIDRRLCHQDTSNWTGSCVTKGPWLAVDDQPSVWFAMSDLLAVKGKKSVAAEPNPAVFVRRHQRFSDESTGSNGARRGSKKGLVIGVMRTRFVQREFFAFCAGYQTPGSRNHPRDEEAGV
jgi:hypothetical protein